MGSAEKASISIQILKTQRVIADKCLVRVRFFERLRGLIGTRMLRSGEGMYFPECNSIHMWFMSIPIDVVFVKKIRIENGKEIVQVSSVHENVKPWRLLPVSDFRAKDVLELPVGTISKNEIKVGMELCFD